MRTLVIAAHPDDEVLGCGGTVARLVQEGTEVYIAIIGEGITSRYAQREQANPDLIQSLQEQSRKVGRLLGAKEVVTFGLPDNRFDTVPLLEIVKIVEELVERIEPQTVYTQHGGDLNIDHVLLYRATLTATRPMKASSVKTVYAYAVASSTEWAFGKFSPEFQPNVFVDIKDTLELKLEAMRLYESESRLFPHPRSSQALQAAAQHWGSMVGLEAAEAFDLVREIR